MSWLSEARDTIKALCTPEHAPILPAFPEIGMDGVFPGDILLFYGFPGTEPTQRLGVNKYGCAFHPPFHAALMMVDGIFHNVGQFTTDKMLSDEFKSSRRIDVIRYQMTPSQRTAVYQATELDTTIPRVGLNITSYGVMDFLHFGFSFIGKGKTPVCSADVVNLLAKGGVNCSPHPALETAPWDLQEYASTNPLTCQQFTLWSGPDYHL